MKSVINNFLGTYASRYSEFDGYWLFGFLVGNTTQIKIDLLDDLICCEDSSTAISTARRLAVSKFADQIEKTGLSRAFLKEAWLDLAISELHQNSNGAVNTGAFRNGWSVVNIAVHAITDLGKVYKQDISICVAPHNPNLESRSANALNPDH